jgi:hypothetical protein
MGFDAAVSPILYSIILYGSPNWYKPIYYLASLIDVVLQFAVIWEITRIVMRPTGSWVRDARKQFILWGAAGILLAAALPWLMTPPAPSFIDRLMVRGNLCASLVTCELIAVVTWTSNRLGLGWRNHVMALGNGWTIWALVAIMVDGLHSYFGAERYFRDLEHLRIFASLGVFAYWMVQFWLEEPVRKPISPELSAYIEALHERVKNNLDTLGAQG